MKKYLLRYLPILFLLGIWLAFSFPYFFQNKIPYPSQYQVSFFTPWNEYPEYAGPIKNNAISDVISQIYPWKHFTIEELKKGHLPVWNPYSFSGNPHLANYQSAVFSPFNVFFFLLPFIDAWSLIVLFQPVLAGLFLYWYLRAIKVSQTGSALGSVAFMFCGFLTVWMPYGTLGMAVAFLPLALFAVEKCFQQVQTRYALLLALSIGISFFSGHFQMSLYVACFIFAYLLFSFFRSKNKRGLLYTLGGFIGGFAVASLQIIPSLQFYQLAFRSESFSNAGAIPWYYLVTVFAPDFFGNPVTRNDWIGHYAEWAGFIGIIPLSLAFVAVGSLFVKRDRSDLQSRDDRLLTFFFFIAGIVTVLLALDTPLQQALTTSKIPILSTSIPSRIIVLFSFSFAVLAALGFDFLKASLKEKSIKSICVFLLPSVVLLFVVWLYVLFFSSLTMEQLGTAKRNLLLPTALYSVMVVAVFVTFFIKRKIIFVLFAIGLLLLTTFDSVRFVNKWVPFESRQVLFPEVPVIHAMQQEIGEGRVYGDIGAYLSTYYRLPVIDGYDPLYSKRYGELIQSAATGKFTPAVRSEVVLDRRGEYTQRILDVLGVTLIYQPIAHTNQPWAFPVWEHPENFPTVYRDDKFALFANRSAMSRVALFSNYEVIPDEKKLVERFFEKDFDYRNVLLLAEDPGLMKNEEQNGSAKIISYEPNKVEIEVVTNKKALLFLSDTSYPGWKVTVNGKEEKIYRANHALRAVVVPEGKSTVIFSYRGLF